MRMRKKKTGKIELRKRKDGVSDEDKWRASGGLQRRKMISNKLPRESVR